MAQPCGLDAAFAACFESPEDMDAALSHTFHATRLVPGETTTYGQYDRSDTVVSDTVVKTVVNLGTEYGQPATLVWSQSPRGEPAYPVYFHWSGVVYRLDGPEAAPVLVAIVKGHAKTGVLYQGTLALGMSIVEEGGRYAVALMKVSGERLATRTSRGSAGCDRLEANAPVEVPYVPVNRNDWPYAHGMAVTPCGRAVFVSLLLGERSGERLAGLQAFAIDLTDAACTAQVCRAVTPAVPMPDDYPWRAVRRCKVEASAGGGGYRLTGYDVYPRAGSRSLVLAEGLFADGAWPVVPAIADWLRPKRPAEASESIQPSRKRQRLLRELE